MKRIIIFAGTTEGRILSEGLARAGLAHIVCVATEYGSLVMQPDENVDIKSGRLAEPEMEVLFQEKADIVYDATHPYAAEVTKNIKAACLATGTEYVRVLRSDKGESCSRNCLQENLKYFPDTSACADALCDVKGNILLTTGSKEVSVFAGKTELKNRLYARVLPSEESIRLCTQAGLFGKQIIAMHGPFQAELNKALIKQFAIRCLVTKQSGTPGGFYEKLQAAAGEGIEVFVIGKPEEETGVTVQEVLKEYGIAPGFEITLIGYGPGGEEYLLTGAKQAIEEADVVFGSSRLAGQVAGKETYPYYLAKDVIGVLQENRHRKAAILFSGDSGFFSGTEKMRMELAAWAKQEGFPCKITVFPGISSLSYLAAKAGEAYQEYPFLSMHGRSGQPGVLEHVLSAIKTNRKVFLILSGAPDVQLLGKMLSENGLSDCEVILGYELSYPEETIRRMTAQACLAVSETGLYAAIVKNPSPQKKRLLPVKKDEDFIRVAGKQDGTEASKRPDAPMTKEMIRHASLIRLELSEGDVLYDVGSGTGSVSVEAACLDPSVRVYAIEKKQAAVLLTGKNAERYHCTNIQIVEGEAPAAFEGLPPATHVFIGGSGGNLKEILAAVRRPDRPVRVVVNAISLETIAEVYEVIRDEELTDLKIEQLAVSNGRPIASYHLMTAENPVMIFSFTLQ